MFNYFDEEEEPKIGKMLAHGGAILTLLIVFFLSFGTVGAGERGVRTQFGAVTGDVVQPGFYFVIPFVQNVTIMDVQTQKEEVLASSASSDLQTVTAKVALNYNLSPDKVAEMYRNIGNNEAINSKLLAPALQESVKSVTVKYTAENLIAKREDVRNNIKDLVASKLEGAGIVVTGFNIVDFSFSHSFNEAIEAKVTAEQNALAAKNKLDQIKYEAEQRIAQAKGEAEAIQIQSKAIQDNGGTAYLQLQAINKWNGALPQYMTSGSATPFINVK